VKRSNDPFRLGSAIHAAWFAAALVFGACSSHQFTADQSTGGDANDGGSSSGGAAGQTSGGTGNAGQAGEPESEAGASNAEGGAAGAAIGAGGDSNAGSGSGGKPSGGSPNGGSGGQPVISPFKAFDDFVASAEGWTVTGDVSAESPALYSGGGGNPDGSISWVDGGGSYWYFTAPAKYLGNDSAFYGGILRFDLKVTAITSLGEAPDVLLTSDTLTLAYDCTPDPTTSYTRYTVHLKETGWKVGTLSGAAATVAQFKQVLSKLTRLRIRGEFNVGSDTGHLDNVYLGMP
jgi:hypothetical protein